MAEGPVPGESSAKSLESANSGGMPPGPVGSPPALPRTCDDSGLTPGTLPPLLVKCRRWGGPDGCDRPPPPGGRRTFKGGFAPLGRESPVRAVDGSREGPWDADDESDDIARYFLIQGRDKRRCEV